MTAATTMETMKMSNPLGMHLARRFSDRPLAVATKFVPALEGIIEKADDWAATSKAERLAHFDDLKVQMLAAYGLAPVANFYGDESGSPVSRKPFAFGNGTAIIPINGTLVNRCNDTACGTMTGYNMIQSSLAAAVNDEDVERILFDVDSGGGEVSGCPETAQMIRDAGAIKPTMAFVDSSCYSAAYWLASAANKLVALSSGGVGSIGCLIAHADYSERMVQEGIKITYIHAGDEKVAGNPYEPLADDTRAKYQDQVEKIRQQFASAVADYRGIPLETVLGTEAGIFDADEGLALGLVDAVSDPAHALSLFDDEPRSDDSNSVVDKREHNGSKKSKSASAEKPHETQGDTMTDDELAALKKEAAEAERNRISAIVQSEEATGRERLASYFAFKTNMSAEDAVAALQEAPVEAKQAAKQVEDDAKPSESKAKTAEAAFNDAMQASGNPGIGAGDGSGVGSPDSGAKTDSQQAADIMASFRQVTGRS